MSAYLSSSAPSPTSSPLKSEFISNYNSSPPLSPGSESADLSLNHHIRPPSSSSSVGRESRCSAATTTGDRSLSESPSCRSPSPTSSVKENGRADGKSEPNPCSELLKPKCNCPELERVDCRLENKELWDRFHELGTEMIITKTGRYGHFSL
jgi:hypothetical protein